jgi:hypothetical protein
MGMDCRTTRPHISLQDRLPSTHSHSSDARKGWRGGQSGSRQMRLGPCLGSGKVAEDRRGGPKCGVARVQLCSSALSSCGVASRRTKWSVLLLSSRARNARRSGSATSSAHDSWPDAGMLLTDVAFLGHYGSQYLAVASLAAIWQGLTWIIVQHGVHDAVSTLCAQASPATRAVQLHSPRNRSDPPARPRCLRAPLSGSAQEAHATLACRAGVGCTEQASAWVVAAVGHVPCSRLQHSDRRLVCLRRRHNAGPPAKHPSSAR